MDHLAAEALELLDELVRIGAPTGQERTRALFVAQWLRDAGLGEPVVDDDANVFLWLGPQHDAALLLDAHLDTVFPDLEVELRKEADRWYAPGISDDTVHVAMLMAWAKHRQATGRPWPATLLSFSVGEEGQGNLLGMKCLTQRYAGRIAQALVLDMGIHSICRQGTGSIRWNVQFLARGGHSWIDFGRTSALTSACQWIAQIPGLAPWQPGRLTWNVGQFISNQGVTNIASQTDFHLEIRGLDGPSLDEAGPMLEDSLRQFAATLPDLQATIHRMGQRPTGATAGDHPLVTTVEQVHRELGLDVRYCVAGTNANWLMLKGIPAVCMGLAQGKDGHTRQESIDLSVMPTGMAKLDRLFDRLTQ